MKIRLFSKLLFEDEIMGLIWPSPDGEGGPAHAGGRGEKFYNKSAFQTTNYWFKRNGPDHSLRLMLMWTRGKGYAIGTILFVINGLGPRHTFLLLFKKFAD